MQVLNRSAGVARSNLKTGKKFETFVAKRGMLRANFLQASMDSLSLSTPSSSGSQYCAN